MAYACKYVGDSLSSLVTEASIAATDRASRSIAQETQRVMLDTARAATPVKSGATRDSWLAPMVERRGQRVEAKIQNTHWLAFLLEYGVQAHEIKPDERKAEMTPEGPRADVHHPGMRAHHMTALAGQMAETLLPMIAARPLQAWQSEIEAMIDAEKRR